MTKKLFAGEILNAYLTADLRRHSQTRLRKKRAKDFSPLLGGQAA